MSSELIDFVVPKAEPSIIMVAGVGGGGSNAVNHMYKMGIGDVAFMVCNTDKQALTRSSVPIKIQLGEGLGAGNKPEKARQAALDGLEEILEIFKQNGTKMVFITAGMGGGTGTGASPVIAQAAKELGILTVAIVTIPFRTEGKKRIEQAIKGIDEIKKHVDSLLIINNENIVDIYGDLPLTEAFGKADDILSTAAKGIAEIITRDYYINVDFADVDTVMRDGGIALMGSAAADGENGALKAIEDALSSPLLNHRDIAGAKNILLNIRTGAKMLSMGELHKITEYIQERTGFDADLIWGAGTDDSLGPEGISITIVATGFNVEDQPLYKPDESHPAKCEATSDPTATPAESAEPIATENPQETDSAPQNDDSAEYLIEIDYEEWERIPAYSRRHIKFVDVRNSGEKMAKIVVKEESSACEVKSSEIF